MAEASKEEIVLTTLLSALLTMEGMEQLQDTDAFRQRIKQTGNNFYKELEKYTSQIAPLVWGVDDKAFYLVMDYQKTVLQKLITMKPEDIGVVMAMIEKYEQHPRKTLTRLEIKLTDNSSLASENK